jgi:hypothetical protein
VGSVSAESETILSARSFTLARARRRRRWRIPGATVAHPLGEHHRLALGGDRLAALVEREQRAPRHARRAARLRTLRARVAPAPRSSGLSSTSSTRISGGMRRAYSWKPSWIQPASCARPTGSWHAHPALRTAARVRVRGPWRRGAPRPSPLRPA